MKTVRKHTTHSPRLTRKINKILLQNRNDYGEISPALEAGLKLFDAPPKTRPLVVSEGKKKLRALIFYTDKLSILWTPDLSLEDFFPYLILLGVDWAFSWNSGLDIAEALRVADEPAHPRGAELGS